MKKNFTQIPNKVLEAMAKSQSFSEKERILIFVLRKTFGWHKKEDWISLSQFSLNTGIQEPNVCRALRKLKGDGVLIKVDKKYRINPNFGEWQGLSKWTIVQSDNKGYPNGKFALSNQTYTKEAPTKENLTKEKFQEFKNSFLNSHSIPSPTYNEELNERNDSHAESIKADSI